MWDRVSKWGVAFAVCVSVITLYQVWQCRRQLAAMSQDVRKLRSWEYADFHTGSSTHDRVVKVGELLSDMSMDLENMKLQMAQYSEVCGKAVVRRGVKDTPLKGATLQFEILDRENRRCLANYRVVVGHSGDFRLAVPPGRYEGFQLGGFSIPPETTKDVLTLRQKWEAGVLDLKPGQVLRLPDVVFVPAEQKRGK